MQDTRCLIALDSFKQIVVPTTAMRLSQWLTENQISLTELAERVGGVTAEAVRLWADGARMPETKNVIRIEAVTNGQVTVRDLHEARAEKISPTKGD